MKKVNIIWPAKFNGGYSQLISGRTEHLSFLWLNRPSKNAEYPVASSFTNCRETLITALWKVIIPDTRNEEWGSTIIYDKKTSMDKLVTPSRVQILVREVSKVNVPVEAFTTRAKRVLNVFEKRLGWRPTKIYDTLSKCPATISDDYVRSVKVHDYVFEFSRKWIRSPVLFSLYLMIVKMCQFNVWDKFKNVDDLQAVAISAKRFRGNYPIISYFTKTYQFFVPMLDSASELFLRKDIKDNYKRYDGVRGFHAFIVNDKPTSEAGKRWTKVIETLNLKRINNDGM